MSALSKILNRLKKGSWFPFYHTFYRLCPIREKEILLESGHGNGIESQIFAFLRELEKEAYKGFVPVLSIRKDRLALAKSQLVHAGLYRHVHLVRTGSIRYYRHLSQAKYLITDASFPGRYIKKNGQMILNVWHGTPLKKMGRDNMAERGLMGNVLRNLLQSDYLLFPNRFMERTMTQAYSLDRLYQGEVLHTGYPRNDIFFRPDEGRLHREEMGFSDQKLYLYMPTYRGRSDLQDRERDLISLSDHLRRFDELLQDHEILLVKLHPFERSLLDHMQYRHVFPFPSYMDTYEGLSACDALLTDYSSVMFDFACCGRPVVLFAYDRDSYEKERGWYTSLSSLPFPVTTDADEAVRLLRSACEGPEETPGSSPRYERKYMDELATWENGRGCRDALETLLFGRTVCERVSLRRDRRRNILLYAGNLSLNGITTAFQNLYSLLDHEKYSFFVSFRLDSVRDDDSRLDFLPPDALLFPLASEMNMDLLTGLAHFLRFKCGIGKPWVERRLQNAYRLEWKKHFENVRFDHYIHFNGYENYMLLLFAFSGAPYTVWAHSDMIKEIQVRRMASRYALTAAYRGAAHIGAVSEAARDSVRLLLGSERTRADLRIILNCQNPSEVQRKAGCPLAFDPDTQATMPFSETERIFSQKDEPVFISIGRFSPEKAHDRLIHGFELFYSQYKKGWLVIIGGGGPLYEQTCRMAASGSAGNRICLIRSLRNPMPFLARGSLFVLSSVYEGCPVTIYEAAFLGLPVLVSDCPGTTGLVRRYGGQTIAQDPEGKGLADGMSDYMKGRRMYLNINCQSENEQTLKTIYEFLS